MYKVLIVASSEAILKFSNEFEKSGFNFDFLLVDQLNQSDFGYLNDQKIIIDQEMIPFDQNDHLTDKHKALKNKTKKEIESLQHILYQNYKYLQKQSVILRLNREIDRPKTVFFIKDVIDLTLNVKERKIYLESNNRHLEKYDQICFEDSYLTLSQFQTKFPEQSFYRIRTESVFQFVGVSYRLNVDFGLQKFWWMSDSNYKSIYDNFYFLNSDKTEIDIWTWLPIQQLTNPIIFNYLSQRIQKKIKERFHFFQLELKAQAFLRQPINTYFELKNLNKSFVSFFPHFKFYSEQQAVDSVRMCTQRLILNLKIKKENLAQDIHSETYL